MPLAPMFVVTATLAIVVMSIVATGVVVWWLHERLK